MIALYTRVSTSDQAQEGYSLEEQEKRLRSYCEAYNLSPVKLYSDPGFTGSNLDRPAMQQLIKDVKKGKITKVIVWKLDRLSRSQFDTLHLIEKVFLPRGVDFVSATENFDTSTPFGRAMLGILSVFAQLEREKIRERVMVGMEARAKQGLFHGGATIPVGYDYTDGQLVVNPYEAELVRRIFRQYVDEGRGVSYIYKHLNWDGLYHKGGAWTFQTVKNILQNRLYIGEIKWGGKYYPAPHQPLVDVETFDRAQVRMEEIREAYDDGKHRGKPTTILGGLIYCGCCGAKYGGHGAWYMCNSKIKSAPSKVKDPNCRNGNWRVDRLTEAVLNHIVEFHLEEFVEQARREAAEEGHPWTLPERPSAQPFRDELEATEKQISRLMDLYALGDDAMPDVIERLKKMQAKKKGLADQIEKIEAGEALERERDRLASEQLPTAADVIATGDQDLITQMVHILIRKVVIKDARSCDVYWNLGEGEGLKTSFSVL